MLECAGDCWLLAAVAGLATEERLLRHVIPDNQSFARGEYAGQYLALYHTIFIIILVITHHTSK